MAPRHLEKVSTKVVTLCSRGDNIPPNERKAIVVTLQRTSASNCDVLPLAVPGALTVPLTKFPHGMHTPGYAFDPHLRFEARSRMLGLIQKEPKWIIAGALATSEMQLAQRLKEHGDDYNPSRV